MTLRYPPMRGAIAAGHPVTGSVAAQILQAGGNAADAAVAAAFASFVAEFTLSTVGGGGFALVVDAEQGKSSLLDFFSAGPGLGRRSSLPPQALDFRQITVDYGPSTQHFYIGRGSVAVPGNVAGLAALAQGYGRLPLVVLLEPAVDLARRGCQVSETQHRIARLIEPILLATPESRAIFGRDGGQALLEPGDWVRMPALADTLEALGREGPALFYRGEVARAIVADQEAHSGLLTLEDLERYRVRQREPLSISFAGYEVLTNPPPSRGGLLICFSLALWEALQPGEVQHGSARHLELLAEVMRVTHLARRELEAQDLQPRQQAPRLLGPATVERWARTLRELLALPVAQRLLDAPPPARTGTTQISVMDEAGLAVSLTTSGGEGPGFVVPGTGVILNNMLGEADLHPQGFHRTPAGQRIPSMMAPTVALRQGRPVLVTGSGGANRIRSAILQVLLNRLAFGLPLAEAVEASRIHFEEGVLHLEGGYNPATADQLEVAGYRVNRWRERHMFFGGAHSVAQGADAALAASGDPRRGGAAVVVD